MARQVPARNGGTLTRPDKGETMNPNGRPKKLPKLDILLADILGEEKDGTTAAEAILKALRLKAKRGDIRAAEVLLERAYGKALQRIKDESDNQLIIKVVNGTQSDKDIHSE